MSTYLLGDIQGSYDSLQHLLETIHFDPASDRLWSCGDLVNRGGKSLQVLRLLKSFGPSVSVTLGNHDHVRTLFFGDKSSTVKIGKNVVSAPGLSLEPVKMTKGGASLPKASTDKDVLDEVSKMIGLAAQDREELVHFRRRKIAPVFSQRLGEA